MRTLTAEAEQTSRRLRTAEEVIRRETCRSCSTPKIEIENARAELLTHTAVAERLREIARQLEGTLERLAQQAEGLAREGERAAAAHAERNAEAEKLNEQIIDGARETRQPDCRTRSARSMPWSRAMRACPTPKPN